MYRYPGTAIFNIFKGNKGREKYYLLWHTVLRSIKIFAKILIQCRAKMSDCTVPQAAGLQDRRRHHTQDFRPWWRHSQAQTRQDFQLHVLNCTQGTCQRERALEVLLRRGLVLCSLSDPWQFVMDPDSRICFCTTDLRIRILLFPSVNFKIPTKNILF